MKTNELMPGDWVTVTEENNEFIGKVQAINAITNYCIVKVGGDWHGNEHDVFIEDMQPVPLTPEILEKNGFENTINNIELDKDNIFKWYDVYGYCVIIILKANQIIIQHNSRTLFHLWYNNLVSVHELQHALRLCGVEKDIVL